MPCTDAGALSAYDAHVRRIRGLVREVFGSVDDAAGLDALTASLCAWAHAHPDEIARQSLELQIWWRDHQAFDRRRETEEAAAHERIRLREQALAKLTPAERKAVL